MIDTSNDLSDLINAGYEVTEIEDWHWEVTHPFDPKKVINVWPTARKYLTKFHSGPAFEYDDFGGIVSAIASCYEKVKLRPFMEELSGDQEDQKEAYEILCYYRSDPFYFIKENCV